MSRETEGFVLEPVQEETSLLASEAAPGAIPLGTNDAEAAKPSFDTTKAFIREAAQTGLFQAVPLKPNETPRTQTRKWNILLGYGLTDFTLEENGGAYGVTRERARQIFKEGVTDVYAATDAEMQSQYPIAEFGYTKPTSERVNMKHSDRSGGRMRTIFEAVRTGKSVADLKTQGLTATDLGQVRRRAKKYDVRIPYTHQSYNPEFRAKLERLRSCDTPPEDVQAILDMVDRGYMQQHRYDEDSPFVMLAELQREAGLRRHGKTTLKDIVDELRALGLPVRLIEREVQGYAQRYGFIASSDRNAVLDLFRHDPAFAKYRNKRK